MHQQIAESLFIVVTLALVAGSGAAAPEDSAGSELARRLLSYDRMPAADPVELDALLPLRMRDGRILVEGHAPPELVQHRFQIHGRPGDWIPWMAAHPGAFRLVSIRPEEAQHEALCILDISGGPAGLNLRAERGGRPDYIMVLLRQSDEDAVLRLMPRLEGDAEPFVAVGRHIIELRERHPEHWNQHVVPMLQWLAGRNFTRPDAVDVLAVFPDIRADPGAVQRVEDILEQADSPDPQQRIAAQRQLQQLSSTDALALLQIDGARLSPQQRSHRREFLRYRPPIWDVADGRGQLDLWFLTECLEFDHPEVRSAALAALRAQIQLPMPFDPTGNEGERLAAIRQLRDHLHHLRPIPATDPTVPPLP